MTSEKSLVVLYQKIALHLCIQIELNMLRDDRKLALKVQQYPSLHFKSSTSDNEEI